MHSQMETPARRASSVRALRHKPLRGMTSTTARNLARSPLHQLHRAMQQADDLFETASRALRDVSRVVLMALDVGVAALSQTALVAHTGIDRSTLSELVRRLQRVGTVTQREAPD